MDQLLEQAVVAITGGARGIGRASAEQLAAAGGRVAIGDLDGEAAAKAASDIGKRAIGIQVDVTDHDSFEAFLEQAEAELGPLDGLVNNAGVMLLGPIDEEDPEQTGTMIAVNLTGVINGTRLAISKMKPRHRGRIINIASQAGKAGLSGGATYCATKFGVIGFSESVRQELKGSGVGISWILPGVVDTAMTAGLPDTRLMEMLSPDEVASAVVKAMKEGGSEVWVPARNQWLDAPLRLLPRHLRERVFAMTGADQVLAGADPERRRGYEGPISGDS
ncbi:MAG: SDR family oxidoreductase [Solirubrobacterales bacterium]|nr:SDR family oxidoreductase [Solirubrobacterales bacterium]HMT05999.1 SDR family oxidoreductase [Solirubrobacterales bacterium]